MGATEAPSAPSAAAEEDGPLNLRQRQTLANGLHRRTDRPAMDTYPRSATWVVAIALCIAILSIFAALDARDAAVEARECPAQQR